MKKIFLVISAMFIISIAESQTTTSYKIADKIHIEGDGNWDYIKADGTTNMLFVSNSSRVIVIDTKINKKIGTITNTPGVHGIAVAADKNKGYTTNSSDTSVTVFNLTTLQNIKRIKLTGLSPDAILYDSSTQKLYTFNATGRNTTVINTINDSVIATIALNGKPESGVSDENGFVYVNINDSNIVRVINSSTNQIVKRFTLGTGTSPKAMAIDLVNHRLFVTCSSKLIVLNYDDGSLVATVPTGGSMDGIAFDPILNRVYCPISSGAIVVVKETDASTFTLLENILTMTGAGTITINPVTQHVYVPCIEYEPATNRSPKTHRLHPTSKPFSFTILDIAPL
ncbi:MAG: YncE family protein [Bacteroidota bacterium]